MSKKSIVESIYESPLFHEMTLSEIKAEASRIFCDLHRETLNFGA